MKARPKIPFTVTATEPNVSGAVIHTRILAESSAKALIKFLSFQTPVKNWRSITVNVRPL